MIIEKYGIKLIRLQQQHIELLRTWRNAEKISKFMEYREQITPEMQQKWFDGLDPVRNMYFMIEYQGKLVGMIHTSHIDTEKGTGEAGLFIYNDELQSTHLPVLASLSMVDVMFGLFNMKRLDAKVKDGNAVAERYNRNLGFTRMPGDTSVGFLHYELYKEKYLEATALLHLTAKKIGGEHFAVKFTNEHYEQLKSAGLLNANAAEYYTTAIEFED